MEEKGERRKGTRVKSGKRNNGREGEQGKVERERMEGGVGLFGVAKEMG
jgi:hypothetical protein